MSETALKNRVADYFKKMPELWYFKVHGSAWQRLGIPDFIGCWRGRFFAIELKVGDNVATPLQERTLAALAKAGAITAVCYTLEEVKRIFEGKENG